MQDERSRSRAPIVSLPTDRAGEAVRSRLKKQLVKFWDSHEFVRKPGVDEAAANLPYRERMASYVPENSRILDIACGTCANARWLLPRGHYYGGHIPRTAAPSAANGTSFVMRGRGEVAIRRRWI